MSVNLYITKDYENDTTIRPQQNKPNQTQFQNLTPMEREEKKPPGKLLKKQFYFFLSQNRLMLHYIARTRIIKNLLRLQEELVNQTYKPLPLKTFILRDPKTRKISKSAFRDRIIHHALVKVIEPIFDKTFIYDSCANRKGKGNLSALTRFNKFMRKISGNGKIAKNRFNDSNFVYGFCLKADIKHYFHEVNHEILLEIIKRKIRDGKVLLLIRKILSNSEIGGGQPEIDSFIKGMPLGNLTSQFFANVYLNELDKFVKHKLRAGYYIRYVDDFVILHPSKSQLEIWMMEINKFLRGRLKIELHAQKSRVIAISKGIDFVGFRNFYHFKLLRKRNIRNMLLKIDRYRNQQLSKEKILEIFQGWNAYAKWANSYKLRRKAVRAIYKAF